MEKWQSTHWSLEDQNCFTVTLALPSNVLLYQETVLCHIHHTFTLSHTTQVDTKHCSAVKSIAVSS